MGCSDIQSYHNNSQEMATEEYLSSPSRSRTNSKIQSLEAVFKSNMQITPILQGKQPSFCGCHIEELQTIDFQFDDFFQSESSNGEQNQMILTLKTLEEIEFEDLLM